MVAFGLLPGEVLAHVRTLDVDARSVRRDAAEYRVGHRSPSMRICHSFGLSCEATRAARWFSRFHDFENRSTASAVFMGVVHDKERHALELVWKLVVRAIVEYAHLVELRADVGQERLRQVARHAASRCVEGLGDVSLPVRGL